MMRSKGETGNLMAMLDVLCCAFGGVMILAVIVAVQIGEDRKVQLHSYLVLEGRMVLKASTPIEPKIAAAVLNTTRMGVLVDNLENGETTFFHRHAHFGDKEQSGAHNFFTPQPTGNEAYFSLTLGDVQPGDYDVRFVMEQTRRLAGQVALPEDTRIHYTIRAVHSGGETLELENELWFPVKALDHQLGQQTETTPVEPQQIGISLLRPLGAEKDYLLLPWAPGDTNPRRLTHRPAY